MLPNLIPELGALRDQGRYRTVREIQGAQQSRICIDGRDILLFCSNNYLGLSNHPALKSAARKAINRFGCSAVASALISGYMTPHAALENRLAGFFGTPSALSFPTGYMANLGAITALVGREDIVFSDRLNHRSLIDGCRLSRAHIAVYNHADTDHLQSLLQSAPRYRRRLILTDGIFSMDGDIAPLPDLLALSRQHQAILMLDDAHGTGVLGSTGRGAHEHFGIPASDIDVLMTSGSKALGAFGGFIAGSAPLIDLLRNRAAAYIYTTALPPDACAATRAALDLIDTQPDLRTRLWHNAQNLRKGLAELGFDTGRSQTQIIPILIGDDRKTVEISQYLYDRGIYLYGIRPPTVPEGQSRLRLSAMATHTDEDIAQFLSAMADVRHRFFDA